jgi:hypothetical protein
MWRCVWLVGLLGCDEGVVECFPATIEGQCGGASAQFCGRFDSDMRWLSGFVIWTDAAGRTLDTWECETQACLDLGPYDIGCACAEYGDLPDTGYMSAALCPG